jgi:hypothetical protein
VKRNGRFDGNPGRPRVQFYIGSFAEPEHVCVADEVVELRNDKDEVHEEPYVEAVEARGVNPGDEILEILANASKFEILEGGKDGAGQ